MRLTKETLNNCWLNNDDGAGFLYVQDGKLKAFKEMKNFDRFFNKYMSIKKSCPESNIVLHFRISTHGVVNKTNCHPFFVNSDLGFVHNGVIYGVKEDSRFSDTYMFNKTILKNLPASFEQNETIMSLIADFIGTGSKLAFLDSSNHYYLVNEEKGHWHDGCWFSNHSYEYVSSYVDYGGTKVYRGSRYGSSYGSSYGSGSTYTSRIDGRSLNASVGSSWSQEDDDELKEWNGSFGISDDKDDDLDHYIDIPSFTDSEIKSATEIVFSQDIGGSFNKAPEHYKIVDSGHVCKECGVSAMDGEIFTSDGVCQDCCTPEEHTNIGKELYNNWDDILEYVDGYSMRFTTYHGQKVIALLEETFINAYKKELEKEENESKSEANALPFTPDYNKSEDEVPSRCDFCAKAETENEELKHIEDWNSHLCSSCYIYTGAELMERRNENNRQWEDDNLAG